MYQIRQFLFCLDMADSDIEDVTPKRLQKIEVVHLDEMKSLKVITKEAIRFHFINQTSYTDLEAQIQQLPLPLSLKIFICQ